jgi:Kef-type K+ transport system membrane component KefB
MAAADVLAEVVNLPDIVGSFLGGLAVNEAVHDKSAKEKLEFFGKSFFVPIFLLPQGFRSALLPSLEAYARILASLWRSFPR